MAKSIDPQIVNPVIAEIVEDLITTKGNLPSTKPFEAVTKPVDEYEGRMRIKTTDKFDTSVFIAAISFYQTQADIQAQKARGSFVCFMDTEVADKLFKIAGLQVPYDEDDETMTVLCGKFAQIIIDDLKKRLSVPGFTSLVLSPPAVYKNTVPDGVAFNKDLKEKQELSFYFLKHKALVVEWTLTAS